jgi:hypothetical protein
MNPFVPILQYGDKAIAHCALPPARSVCESTLSITFLERETPSGRKPVAGAEFMEATRIRNFLGKVWVVEPFDCQMHFHA